MRGEPSLTKLDDKLAGFGVRSDIYVPILSKGAGTGFLCLGSYRVAGFTMEDVQNAENLSNQISIALENTKLLSNLEDMFVNVVKTLASAIDAKSPWTKGHSERVTKYAVMIAEKMNIEPAEIEKLRLGGFLHDIGKIGTFDVILDKPGKLTAEEFELVKKHPAKGEEILSPIKQFKDIIPVVLYHHERWDGTGYPEGLKGEKIPLLARILCVADSYDSMTADRPYRSAPGIEYAVSEFRNCSGTQFDPRVVEVFVEILGEKKKAA
jgi:putative nucleotidyltransferase with HDIG domain